MKKKILWALALLLSLLITAPVFLKIQIAHADNNSISDCVCDHYDNENYLGSAYDMWTGTGIMGHYPDGYDFSTVDYTFESGYGAFENRTYYNPGIPPLDCYWYLMDFGSGDANYYTTNYIFNDTRYVNNIQCIGYYWDVWWLGTNGEQTVYAADSTTNTFDLYQLGDQQYDTTWTDYGSMCAVEAPGFGPIRNVPSIQNSPNSV